jgi:hypothetical protein
MPAQLDHGREFAVLNVSAADGFGSGFIYTEHRMNMRRIQPSRKSWAVIAAPS